MSKIVTGERIGKTAKISASVSAFIFSADRQSLILVQRKDNGKWCLPGGMIEPGETISEACYREIREETGVDIAIDGIIGVYSNPNLVMEYPDGNRFQCLEIDLEAHDIGGKWKGNNETVRADWFSIEAITNLNVMETERERLIMALSGKTPYIR